MNVTVDVESLHRLAVELPPEARIEARDYLQSLIERIDRGSGSHDAPSQEESQGLSEAFLQTFGAWRDDPRTTEEIIEETYSSRTSSDRDAVL